MSGMHFPIGTDRASIARVHLTVAQMQAASSTCTGTITEPSPEAICESMAFIVANCNGLREAAQKVLDSVCEKEVEDVNLRID